ncbi:MAG: class I SAM-dependent methyltransferase [Pirellulales bacterium]|nr:class I SAM-dependent methyltransferase [Pirellulales bacterium]
MLEHGHKALVEDVELRPIKLRGCELDLYVAPGSLFLPNAVSRLFAKVVEIRPGDIVFDIGTGTGVLAVWAATQPSQQVHAVDPVKEHCELALRNATRHGVADKVNVYQGSLFDPLPLGLRAEVIIGDVSGIADGPGRALGWYSSDVPTGGGDGTEVVIDLIRQAHRRLQPGGRLYFPIAVGLSDGDKVMAVARECFTNLVKKVDVWFPLSDEEYDLVACCLPPALLSKICQRGSRMAWNGLIYEATKPTGG